AGMLKTPDIITAAAGLLGAEAEHAAAIRTHIARLKIATTAIDGVDLSPPPSGDARQVLPLKVSDGLIAPRPAWGGLYLAGAGREGGLLETGVNGIIISSTEAAAAAKIVA